jgi:hypothetical protein
MRLERRLVLSLRRRMRSFLSVGAFQKVDIIKCPPHGYEKWRLVQFVFQGLT